MATRTITTRLAVDGETEFKRAMSGVNSELRTLKSELALADAEFRGQANSLEYLSKKQDILSREYQQQGEKVKALEQAVRDSTDAYGENDRKTQEYKRQLNQARIELINLNNALQDNERYLREAEQSADGTADSIDELGREIEDTDGALDGAGKSGLKFGDILKANVVSSVIIGGLKKLASFLRDFAKSSIEAGKAFDSAMSQVAATMGVTINQIGKLRDFAKEMGSTTAFSATEAAQGLNILAMAGLSAEEQMSALPQVLDLAAAGTLALDDAASYVTGTIKGFKDEMSNAQYYTDLIAKGATMANTSVTGLGEAMSRGAATANGYHQSADTLALSLLRLAEQNLEGEEASTALNRAMADLYTTTPQAKKVLDELGFSAYTEAGAAREFNEVIDDLNLALADMTDSERNAALAAIFTTQGLNAFNKMVATSPEKLEEFRAGLDSAFGSAAQQADTQLDNLAGDLTLFDSAVEGLKIRISDALTPALRVLVQGATTAVSALAGLGAAADDLPVLVSGTKELLDALNQSADAYISSSEVIQQNADNIRSLVTSLEELDNMSLRTSAQNQAMLDIIQQLNAAIPDLNLTYDEQIESLNMNAEAVRELAAAEAERQDQAEGVRRLNELLAEQAKIESDLEAAEAQLAAARENRANLEGIFTKEIRDADKSVRQAVSSYNQLKEALRENENALSYFTYKYGDAKDAIEAGSDAMDGGTESADDLTAATEDARLALEALAEAQNEARDTTNSLVDGVQMLDQALREQSESGSLSLDTALKLIDAGYAAAISFDAETGAIHVNREAYIALAQSQMEQRISELESAKTEAIASLNLKKDAADALTSSNYDLAISYYKVAEADAGQIVGYDAQINALKALQSQVGSYTGSVNASSRSTSRAASRAASSTASASKQVKSQAEKDLETYKNLMAELDHQRNMDEVNEEAYYKQLQSLRDKYLTDEANISEYRKVTEELYKYSKELAEEAAEATQAEYESLMAELEYQRNMDRISEEDYYRELGNLRDQYLTDDGSIDEYRKITESIYNYDKSLGEKEASLWIAQTETLLDELEERYNAVLSAQNQMEENLANYGNLFEIKDDKMSLNNLQAQIDAINSYEEALSGLREKGISDSLMDQVLSMDVDSATQYAKQLLNMTDKQWDEYNALWNEKQQRAMEVAEEFYRNELDALETEYNDKLADALGELKDTAFNSGLDTVQGLIAGLQAQEGALYAQAAQMVQQVSAILSSATGDIASTFSTANLQEPKAATAQDVHTAASNIVNGVGALSPDYSNQNTVLDIYMDTTKVATAMLPASRAVSRANPEVKDDR